MKITIIKKALIGLVLVLLVLISAELTMSVICKLAGITKSDKFVTTLIMQIFIGLYSILISYFLSKKRLPEYGFNLTKNIPYLKILLLVLVVSLVSNIIISFFPMDGPGHFAMEFETWQLIIATWFIAPISEEFLMRGLLQSYLNALKKYSFKLLKIKISLPVVIGAFYFSLIHLPLLFMGMGLTLGIFILISCFTTGLIAGYYRESSGSLLPAILIHSLANIINPLITDLLNFIQG